MNIVMKIVRNYRFWIGILFILFIVLLRVSKVTDHITLASIQEKRLDLLAYVHSHYVSSVLVFIGFYIFIVVAALPIAGLSTIVSGFLFGVIPGVIYSNIGATVGATIFFLIVRHAFGNSLQERYAQRLKTINEYVRRYGVFYLIAFRFIATIPFFIENSIFAMTKISVWTFIWTTAIGIFPGSIVYAFAGQKLATITSIKDIFSLEIILAFMLLALIALIPIIIHQYWQRRSKL